MGGGGKGRSCTTIGYTYFMGLHIGVCRGPIDELIAIEAGGKVAWTGSVKQNTTTYINAPNLFGGTEREGGLQGHLTILMGGKEQAQLPAGLEDLYHGTQGVMFRGTLTMYYNGEVSSMSPYIKPWKFRCRRTRAGWENRPAELGDPEIMLAGKGGMPITAMNPVHIIWEALTNEQWGGGFEPRRLHLPSFAKAAETLRKEKFGLCLYWSRKVSIADFVSSVQKYIEALSYVDRTDGLLHLELCRECEKIDDLPIFSDDNGLLDIEDIEIPTEFGAVNEVVIKWHDPITDTENLRREQNIAGILSSSQIVSTSLSFPGLPTSDLAAYVAIRELRKRAKAPRKFKLKLDRRAWDLHIGSLIRISSNSLHFPSVPLRIMRIEDGKLENGIITVTAYEDVYSLTSTKMSGDQETEFTPPDFTPQPPRRYCFMEMSYRELCLFIDRANLKEIQVGESWFTAIMTRPTVVTTESRFRAKPRGAEKFPPCVRGGFGTWAKLKTKPNRQTIKLEITEWEFSAMIEDGNPALLTGIDTHGKGLIEIVTIEKWDGATKTLSVKRGCVDTLPHDWTKFNGVELWYSGDSGGLIAAHTYSANTELEIKLSTLTGVEESSIIDENYVLVGRQGRPYPPANVKICGEYFPLQIDWKNAAVQITWATRDRIEQMEKVIDWYSESVGLEDGTTYTLFIDDGEKGRIVSETGLSEPNFTPDLSSLIAARPEWNEPVPPPSEHELTLTLFSVRDGIESWQRFVHTFTYIAPSPEPLPRPADPPTGGITTP